MAKQTVNIGTSVNKGDGDPLRTAFTKINENFTELYVIPGPYANDAAAGAAGVAVGRLYHKTGTNGQIFVRLA
jgi:hypothetical protein